MFSAARSLASRLPRLSTVVARHNTTFSSPSSLVITDTAVARLKVT